MAVVLTSRQRDTGSALMWLVGNGAATVLEFRHHPHAASSVTSVAAFTATLILMRGPRQPPKWNRAGRLVIFFLVSVGLLGAGALIAASHHEHQILALLYASGAVFALMWLARSMRAPPTPAH